MIESIIAEMKKAGCEPILDPNIFTFKSGNITQTLRGITFVPNYPSEYFLDLFNKNRNDIISYLENNIN